MKKRIQKKNKILHKISFNRLQIKNGQQKIIFTSQIKRRIFSLTNILTKDQMGNVCEFDSKQVVRSFDDYDKKKITSRIKTKKLENAHQQILEHNNDKNEEVILQETAKTQNTVEDVITKKKQENLTVHKITVTPPSQTNFGLFKKLDQQSQVPSDFFQNVDLSIYFKTLKTLKQNVDPNCPLSERKSNSKFNRSSNRFSMNSLADCVGDEQIENNVKLIKNRKSSITFKHEEQIKKISELKKTKMYLADVSIPMQ